MHELSLSHNSIGHEGTLALAKEGITAISSELKNLSYLILSKNCIDSTGMAAVHKHSEAQNIIIQVYTQSS